MTTHNRSKNLGNNHEKVEVSEIKMTCLMVLEKKPLDNYFKGTRDKKKSKKKLRIMDTFKPSEFNDLESQSNVTTSIQDEEQVNEERSAMKKKLEDNLKGYQVMKESEHRNNQIKQRLKEKNSLQQQEDLVDTWFDLVKRRNELKDGNLGPRSSFFEHLFKIKTKCYPHIGMSLISKEFWNDDEDASKKESKVKIEQGSSSNNTSLEYVEEELLKKLVFVDDEKEICHHSKRCQQVRPS